MRVEVTPLIKGFIFKKKIVRFFFKTLDRIQSLNQYTIPEIPNDPKNILVSNLGNLGDILISLRTVSALRQRYSNAKFGFLLTPSSKSALENVEGISQIHTIEHPYQSRRRLGLCKAALHYQSQRKKVVQELREARYDIAIDLQPFYPNAVPLFFQARIPVRIGYPTAGFGAQLTHPFRWNNFRKYLGELHMDHLHQVGFPKMSYSEMPFPNFAILKNLPEKFIIIQMLSSREEKNWIRSGWIELINKLKFSGVQAILIGHGVKDSKECEIVSSATGCLNLCDRLKIAESIPVLQRAKGLLTVDSMSLHLGAMISVPTIVLLSEINCPDIWIPSNGRCKAILWKDVSMEEIYKMAMNL